jgi:hypothetical protein
MIFLFVAFMEKGSRFCSGEEKVHLTRWPEWKKRVDGPHL